MAEEELNLNVLLNRHKSLILNIFMVLAALYFASKVYTFQSKKIVKLSRDRNNSLKKNEALEDIRKLENRLNLYRSFMTKDVSLVVNTLSDLAKQSSIRIVAISPEAEQDTSAYIKYPFSLSLEADNYNNLGSFMSKFESHHDIFTVDSIVIKPGIVEAGSKKTKLLVNIKMNTVLFK
ncbi:MAG: type 4a pilus biogenesis protein PilO [Candidatus Omnitrophica bacterium]|nr:type 4a pilus biogenesis protein PilO [Candidatus Omnitrophota bacterium]